MPALLAGAFPLLLIALTASALAVAAARSLRDEAAVERLRAGIRLLGETQRAVVETRTRTADRRLRG